MVRRRPGLVVWPPNSGSARFLKSQQSTLTLPSEEQHLDSSQRFKRLKSLWKRHMHTIVAGAPRYSDRLKCAGIVDSDLCQTCNKRCTAEHWYYERPDNCGAALRRRQIHSYVHDISTNKHNGQSRARTPKAILELPCFRICGICLDPDIRHSLELCTSDAEARY